MHNSSGSAVLDSTSPTPVAHTIDARLSSGEGGKIAHEPSACRSCVSQRPVDEVLDLAQAYLEAGVQPPLLVSPEEAARLLSISRRTIYDLMDQDKLPSRHIGRARRIPFAALQRFAVGAADSPEIPAC